MPKELPNLTRAAVDQTWHSVFGEIGLDEAKEGTNVSIIDYYRIKCN